MQYEPLDIEAYPFKENKQDKEKKKQQKASGEKYEKKEINILSQQQVLQQQQQSQVQQLVYINTLSFQAMEADISLAEYLSIFFGCGTAVYLFIKLLPLLTIEDCGEIGFRGIALISIFYFSVPPLCLCSTGFKNNKKLCLFVSKFFFVISLINLLLIIYVFSVSYTTDKWYKLESQCRNSEQSYQINFQTTQIILCQIFLSINGFVVFALMRNLAKSIEKRDWAVRKKMVILPHKIINVNIPVFYDQMLFFFLKKQVPALWTCLIL
ncbi:hypothetical protein ABPG74_003164 [Tetrahymena malaccensis]